MPNPLLQELWNVYRDELVPSDISPIQMRECRRAFYAGASMMLSALHAIGTPRLNPSQALEILADIDAELEAFGDAVKNGRA